MRTNCGKSLRNSARKTEELNTLVEVCTVLFPMIFERKKSTHRYKYPVFRADDRPSPLSSRMIKEMDEDELWETLKKFCEKD
jgi:hypothetical protein